MISEFREILVPTHPWNWPWLRIGIWTPKESPNGAKHFFTFVSFQPTAFLLDQKSFAILWLSGGCLCAKSHFFREKSSCVIGAAESRFCRFDLVTLWVLWGVCLAVCLGSHPMPLDYWSSLLRSTSKSSCIDVANPDPYILYRRHISRNIHFKCLNGQKTMDPAWRLVSGGLRKRSVFLSAIKSWEMLSVLRKKSRRSSVWVLRLARYHWQPLKPPNHPPLLAFTRVFRMILHQERVTIFFVRPAAPV